MARKIIDLVLVAVVLAGGVLAVRAGRERAVLAAHHRRLVAAAGELAVEDPKLVYVKAIETGDPLHFAWRVHLPAAVSLNVRFTMHGNASTESWTPVAAKDFIARVQLRPTVEGRMEVYVELLNSRRAWTRAKSDLSDRLRHHANNLKIDQIGRPCAATIDPKAKPPTVLLRVSLPASPEDRHAVNDKSSSSTPIVELMIGPPGSLP